MATLIHEIAQQIAILARGNADHIDMAHDAIGKLARQFLPSGSGFDCGSQILVEESRPDRIVLLTDYHHMTEGCYDGWTQHKIILTPSFTKGFDMRITGRNRNEIKEYITDVFHDTLNQQVVATFNARTNQREYN